MPRTYTRRSLREHKDSRPLVSSESDLPERLRGLRVFDWASRHLACLCLVYGFCHWLKGFWSCLALGLHGQGLELFIV